MVTKRLIEVDDDKLDEVPAPQGTRTLTATVAPPFGATSVGQPWTREDLYAMGFRDFP